MKIKLLLLAVVCILFQSCNLKVITRSNGNYPPQNEVVIIQTNQPLPNKLKRIGSVVVGENGLTPTSKCSYENCIQTIENEAKKMGGNVVYLVRVEAPNFHSTCYNITADIYLQE